MSGDTLTSAIFLSEVGNHVQNLFLYFVGTRWVIMYKIYFCILWVQEVLIIWNMDDSGGLLVQTICFSNILVHSLNGFIHVFYSLFVKDYWSCRNCITS
jgi:hypothetical protein